MIHRRLADSLLNLLLALGLLGLLANEAKFKQGYIDYGDWQAANFADPAGYSMYLPATFIYHWDWKKFPDGIQHALGYGFVVDHVSGKVVTKYTYPVALMQGPFYLVAHGLTHHEGLPEDGFSGYYRFVPVWAGVGWGWLGLLMLRSFLRRKGFSSLVSWFTILGVLFGTNLIYYSTDKGGFAHVYNFALVSGFLLLLQSWVEKPERRWRLMALVAMGAFMVLARPTLIFMAILVPFWEIGSWQDVVARFRLVMRQWLPLAVGLVLAVGIAFPQIAYWKYLSGSFLHYSYNDEGFHNALHPKFGLVLFAPNNGMLPWAPLLACMLSGLVLGLLAKVRPMIPGRSVFALSLLGFVFLLYTSASWHIPTFGSGFGHRNMVDFLPLLSIGLATLIAKVVSIPLLRPSAGRQTLAATLRNVRWKGLLWRIPVVGVMLTCVLITLRLNMVYCSSWFGKDDWDWKEYFQLLSINPSHASKVFESASLPGAEIDPSAPQGRHVLHMRPDLESVIGIDVTCEKFGSAPFRHAMVSAWVRTDYPGDAAFMKFQVLDGDSVIYGLDWNMLENAKTAGKWERFRKRTMLPLHSSDKTRYTAYPVNSMHTDFRLDDLRIFLY